jgi:lipoprotein NlpI
MDKPLAELLTAWWTTNDQDAARALAERLAKLSPEQVTALLMEFRSAVLTVPALAETLRHAGQGMATIAEALARALGEGRKGNSLP